MLYTLRLLFVISVLNLLTFSTIGLAQSIPNKGPKIGTITSMRQEGCGCTFTKAKADKKTIFISFYGDVNGEDNAFMFIDGKLEKFTLVKTIKNITIYCNDTYVLTQTAKLGKKTGYEVSEESGTIEIEVRKPPIGQLGSYTTKTTYFGECGC
jgi:hypothetical protein